MDEMIAQTLNSPDYAVWQIIALESGMPISDVKATSKVRYRLLAATTLCDEILDDTSAPAVVEVFRQINIEANLAERSRRSWPQTDHT